MVLISSPTYWYHVGSHCNRVCWCFFFLFFFFPHFISPSAQFHWFFIYLVFPPQMLCWTVWKGWSPWLSFCPVCSANGAKLAMTQGKQQQIVSPPVAAGVVSSSFRSKSAGTNALQYWLTAPQIAHAWTGPPSSFWTAFKYFYPDGDRLGIA